MKKIFLIAGTLLSACIVIMLLVVPYLPVRDLIEQQIYTFARKNNIASIDFELEKVGMTRSVLKNIVLGGEDGLTIKNITITYSPYSLWQKKVHAILIEKVALSVYTTGDSVSFGALDRLFDKEPDEEANTTPFFLPFDKVQIKNALLSIDPDQPKPVTRPWNIESATITTDPSQNELIVKATIKDITGYMTVHGDARYNLKTQNGKAEVMVPGITFTSGVLQPEQIFPVLRGKISSTSGEIAAQMQFSWQVQNKEIKKQVWCEIRLTDFASQFKDIYVEGINTNLIIDDFWPLHTKGKQSLTIAKLDGPLPLKDGKILFQVDDKKLFITNMAWQVWSSGIISAENVALTLGALEGSTFTIKAEHIDLTEVSKFLQKEALYAEGMMKGTIPVVIRNGNFVIHDGFLKTTSKGTIQYTGANDMLNPNGNEQMALTLSLLKDFHYETLGITLNNDQNNHLTAHLALYGYNPDIYDGRAVKFNINLTGNIFDLLKDGINTYQLPEKIMEQITHGKIR